MVYTVENRFLEEPSIPYDDGLRKLYLYTKGTAGNPGISLCDMLKYMEMSTEGNVTDDNIAKRLEEGLTEGQERINQLNLKLIEASCTEDRIRAAGDKEFQQKLLEEFGI